MRPVRLIIAAIFLATGVVLGALNAQPVVVDLGAMRLDAPLGIVILVALLIGVLAGGLALTASVVLPMRRRRRHEQRRAASHTPTSQPSISPIPDEH
ncbi:MAG: LapA family protein [Lysobacteraceae bacterium]|nr:MAG: LapA family protein [Xanthomonadaceae bacterium]